MNALVEQTAFGVTTNSRTVAEVFEKEHKNVLASIDELIDRKPELRGLTFQPTSVAVPMPNNATREVRAFEMNRDGFTLLAMGFTGVKALDWKLAYIEAFNRMEADLTAPRPLTLALEPADLLPALAVVREARMLFGRPVARRLWPQLGLPAVTRTEEVQYELATGFELPPSIGEWMEYCVIIDPAEEAHASALFQSYEAWCSINDAKSETQAMFGRAMTHMGFQPKKSRTGNVLRKGLRLIG